MNSDQYGSGIITLLLGVTCLVVGIVSIKKKRFLETDVFSGFQNTLFLPPIVNFLAIKIVFNHKWFAFYIIRYLFNRNRCVLNKISAVSYQK